MEVVRFPVTRVQPRKYTDIIRRGRVSFVTFIPTSEPSALHPFPPFFLPIFPSGKLFKRRVQERFAFFEATRTFAIIAFSRVIQFFFSPFVTRGWRKSRVFATVISQVPIYVQIFFLSFHWKKWEHRWSPWKLPDNGRFNSGWVMNFG